MQAKWLVCCLPLVGRQDMQPGRFPFLLWPMGNQSSAWFLSL